MYNLLLHHFLSPASRNKEGGLLNSPSSVRLLTSNLSGLSRGGLGGSDSYCDSKHVSGSWRVWNDSNAL